MAAAVSLIPWTNSVFPRPQATIRGLKSQVSELEAAAASLRAEAAMARRQQEAAAREAAAARAARGQAEAELRQQVGGGGRGEVWILGACGLEEDRRGLRARGCCWGCRRQGHVHLPFVSRAAGDFPPLLPASYGRPHTLGGELRTDVYRHPSPAPCSLPPCAPSATRRYGRWAGGWRRRALPLLPLRRRLSGCWRPSRRCWRGGGRRRRR